MRKLNPAEQMPIFYPDPAEQHMRQQGMREHLGGYLEGLENGDIDPGMRTYQRLGFPRILKKAYKDLGQPVDVHAETSDALDQLTHPQIAEATMGYGKSFLLAHLAVATGIGQLPYEGATQPLKALYISYTKRGVSEIVKACRTFTPQLKVVRYAEQPKAKQRIEEIEEGDVIAISYAALSIAVKRRLDGLHTPLDGQQFDLIGSDENHHRWSRSFGAAVNAFARGKVEVGMTGTRRITEENKNVPVSFRFSARDMVDTGHAPSVQLLAFPTGKHITAGIRTPRDPFKAMEKSYSWKQLQPLALDPERNYQIVELLKMLASRGHTILGGMIAGARCTHGKIIKALANEERIVDPVTGKRRKLNFEAVDGYMKDSTIDKLIERAGHPFAESGLDGLLSTSLLTESVDNPNFSAAVVGSPMPFIPLAQFMGRLSRGEPTDTTVIAQLIDRARHTRAPAFIGDVYEEGEFFNGMIIGQRDVGGGAHLPPDIAQKPSSKKPSAGGTRSSIDLEEVVKTTFGKRMDALESYLNEWRNVPIYSEIFEANSTLLSEPPADSIKVADLYKLPGIREAEIKEASFYELLHENGFRYSRVETDEGITNYVHQAGEVTAFLENYQFPPKDAPKRYTIFDLARSFSVSINVITDEIATLTAAGEHMMPEVGKKGRLAYSERQKGLLGEALERRREGMVPETDGPPYEQLSPLAAELGIWDRELKQFVQTVRNSDVVRLVSRESQTRSTYVKPEDAAAARFHYGLEEVPSTATLLNSIGKDFDADESTVARAFEAIGQKDAVKQGRQIIKREPATGIGGTKYGKGFQITYPLYCDNPTAVAAVQQYMIRNKDTEVTPAGIPGNYRNVAQALEDRGVHCDPGLLSMLIKRAGQTPRLDKLKRPYLDDGGIDFVVRQAQSLPPLTDKFMTFEDLAVICKQAGLQDINTEDIHNLYRADVLGLQPLRREGRTEVLKLVSTPGGTTTLRVYFKRFFAGEVVERLQLMQRTMRLPDLKRLRRSR